MREFDPQSGINHLATSHSYYGSVSVLAKLYSLVYYWGGYRFKCIHSNFVQDNNYLKMSGSSWERQI